MYIDPLLSILVLPLNGLICWIVILILDNKKDNDKTK